ncbi:MAG: two-component system, response regulator RegA [Desulfovibrionales bacterium]|nr:two-component system, response regulator RegA [Desulfovibrionales bacterium]
MQPRNAQMNDILIIDSDTSFLSKLAGRLEARGMQVHTAASANAGLALFQTKLPKNVVVELFLPEKDGIEILQAVKKSSPNTNVIVLSGSVFFDDYTCLHAARIFGATATVGKENDLDATLDRVEAVLTTPGVLFQEKRKYPRKRVDIPAMVSANPPQTPIPCRLRDLSLQSALLLVEKSNPQAVKLLGQDRLRLMLGRSRSWKNTFVCAPCRVVETERDIQLGLTFFPLDERSLKELSSYL